MCLPYSIARYIAKCCFNTFFWSQDIFFKIWAYTCAYEAQAGSAPGSKLQLQQAIHQKNKKITTYGMLNMPALTTHSSQA